MLRAVFVRTLKPGVSYEDFKDAWVPEGTNGDYPATASVSRNVTNARQVITIIELDASLDEFAAISSSLTRPDAIERLAKVVDSTELEGVFIEEFDTSTL